MPTDTKTAARVAAEWWAAFLSAPATPSRFDNGDATTGPPITRMLTMQARSAPAVTPEQVEAFTVALETDLSNQPHYFSVGCDYHPDRYLADALASAGIPKAGALLPIKSGTYYNGSTVKTKQGYAAPFVTIWMRS